ncbi:MAG: hypothetical protein ACI8ZM_001831 [Crocinitomix sp.]|jgi:hypothetical protein
MQYHAFSFVALNLLIFLSGQECFCQNNTNDQGVQLSIQQSNQGSIICFDPCAADNVIKVSIKNVSDSTVQFYKTNNCWGYATFSFEIETEDTIFNIKRAHRLWWRCVPEVLSIAPNDSVLLTFQLIDSTCMNSTIRFKKWSGLPVDVRSTAFLKVIYNPPNSEIRKQHGRLFNQERDYRNGTYRDADTTYLKVEQNIDSVPLSNEILETSSNGNWVYNKQIKSESIRIQLK